MEKIDTSKLVKAEQLLEALFPPESRPTVRWLRRMQRKRVIPYYKLGHGVWYNVEKVREAFEKKALVRCV